MSTPNYGPPSTSSTLGTRIMGGINSLAKKLNLTGEPSPGAIKARDDFMNRNKGGGSSTKKTVDQAPDMSDIYAENLRRYNEYMQSQQQQPQQPVVTPEMRQAALQTFESQQGAGQVPYYMAAARNQYNPNMSPAFQYAAQNYDILGGSQRLAPRPMEMMSVAERRQVNDMAQAMANQGMQQIPPQSTPEIDYQRGIDMVMRGSGKGGGATMPQKPTAQIGMPTRMPSNFGAILAQRFGSMY